MPEGGMIRISGENHITAGSTFLPDAGGRYVKIAIEDSGIGMPVNAVEKIFDPYFSTKQEGSGLGLAITQSIIQKHNGHITVESSPGSGSTFTIYLPASEKCRTQSRRSLTDVAPPAPVKILIMDDDEFNGERYRPTNVIPFRADRERSRSCPRWRRKPEVVDRCCASRPG
jgi:two-component system cell cycle sensor histidine kinase/response regulator CckA